MKSIVRIALVAVLGFLNGCGQGTTLTSLSGTWVFTLKPADSPSDLIQATVGLSQIGNELSGQVTLTGNGTSCGTQAAMSGFVNGNALSLRLTQSQSTLTLTGTATTGVTINASGAYTATAGQCLQNGGKGTWSGSLQTNMSSVDEKSHPR